MLFNKMHSHGYEGLRGRLSRLILESIHRGMTKLFDLCVTVYCVKIKQLLRS